MAKVEIDEEELVRSQKLRDTVAKIWANPKTRVQLQALHKEVDPQAVTPDLDQQQPINEAIAGIQKTVNDFITESKKDKDERNNKDTLDALNSKVSSGLATLRRQGWTDEGIKGVEKLMQDHGIVDPEIAASHYEKLHPPQQPVTPGGTGSWNFMEPPPDDQADLKKLMETKGESEPLLSKMVRDTLADVRGAPSRR